MATSNKGTTTITFNWPINHRTVQKQGFVRSGVFGTEKTKFYLYAGIEGSYKLYLSSNSKECIVAQLKYTIYNGSVAPDSCEYFKECTGFLSLDKSLYIGHAFWKWNKPWIAVNVITFQDDPTTLPNQWPYQTMGHINGHSKPMAISPTEHRDNLCRKLGTLRQNPILSDVTLYSTHDRKEFPAHKVILSAVSPVFAAMFSNEQFIENQKKRVEVNDISSDVMKVLLDYIYSGDVANICQFAGELLIAADKYDIQPLLQACTNSMLANITTATAARYFYIADLYKLPQLKLKAVEFISKNKKTVGNSDGWKQYIRSNQALFEQLFFES